MSNQFYTILTNLGKAKIANSGALGTKVNFVKFKIGDGGGAYYNPTETQTDVKNKVWEGNISSISIDESNPSWIVIETVIPTLDGGFTIREAGIFDDENNLIAIGKYPATYKPVAAEGSSKDLMIRMILEVSNAESVNLKVDPTVILATKKDIQTLESNIQETNAQLSESMNILIPTTGSTANSIVLKIATLKNNQRYSFKANATSTGNVTINGKAFKKTDGTQIGSGGVKSGKVYDFYYDSSADCVFILAKAEGDSTVADVLAGKIFSNGDDTGLIGTMPNNGTVNQSLAINGTYTIPKGYHNGTGKVTQSVTTKAAAIITPGTTNQTIPTNIYTTGIQTILGDPDLLAANIVSGKNIFSVTGSATITSLGGAMFTSGSAVPFKNGTTTHAPACIDISTCGFTPNIVLLHFTGYYVKSNGNTSSLSSDNIGMLTNYGHFLNNALLYTNSNYDASGRWGTTPDFSDLAHLRIFSDTVQAITGTCYWIAMKLS